MVSHLNNAYNAVTTAATNTAATAAGSIVEGCKSTFNVKNIANAANYMADGFVESHLPTVALDLGIRSAVFYLGTTTLAASATALATPLVIIAAPMIIAPAVPCVAREVGKLAAWSTEKAAGLARQAFSSNNNAQIPPAPPAPPMPVIAPAPAAPAPVVPAPAPAAPAQDAKSAEQPAKQDKAEGDKKAKPEEKKPSYVAKYGQMAGATYGPAVYTTFLNAAFGPLLGNFVVAPLTTKLVKPAFQACGETVSNIAFDTFTALVKGK